MLSCIESKKKNLYKYIKGATNQINKSYLASLNSRNSLCSFSVSEFSIFWLQYNAIIILLTRRRHEDFLLHGTTESMLGLRFYMHRHCCPQKIYSTLYVAILYDYIYAHIQTHTVYICIHLYIFYNSDTIPFCMHVKYAPPSLGEHCLLIELIGVYIILSKN